MYSHTVVMPNYYELLGCDATASYQEIKKCYYEKAKKFHPDKSKSKSQKEFLHLDKAWKVLRDTNLRREYDLSLSKNDVENTPLYCEIDLSEMSREPGTTDYNLVCRCGGIYILHESEIDNCERIMVSCDECTFHIIVNISNLDK